MIGADQTDSRLTPSSLFESIAFPGDAYCEAFTPQGEPREHWRRLMESLGGVNPQALNKRQDRVRRMRHEDGATFNPFDDPATHKTPWALEMFPLPLTDSEWTGLESALIQRAELLEKIIADAYGPQNLLKRKNLPAELFFANPGFLRVCHGIRPAGYRYLTFYAVDLYRGMDGRFRVLRDHGSHPAGLGYALENRIVISRVFSDLFHKNQILRLALFFQAFHSGLLQRASFKRDDPEIVLLSPGPNSRIYFEQALLSRYLGYPLVESQDLTVRNGEVFLNKLAGLEPVEAIFRHIDDDGIDPFTLRKATGVGVAGLIQASREGNVDIVNPIGAGFIDTPVLQTFLPDLSRTLMGEELMMDSLPSWWCGTTEGLDRAMNAPDGLSIVPALDRLQTLDPSTDPAALVNSAPHSYMVREMVRPAVVPAWDQGMVRSKYYILRVFLCASEDGFTVLPGGLAITAPDIEALIADSPHDQQSKDVWILSDHPVEPFSLMSGLQTAAELRRGSDLPSRVADHLLWLGRYLERAEGLVRLLRSVFRRLSSEAAMADIPELLYLLNLLKTENAISPALENGPGLPKFKELYAKLNMVLYDPSLPGGMISVLKQVQDAARNVRDRLSLDSWRVINRIENFTENPAEDPLDFLDETLFTLSSFSGLAMESMTRGLGWRFMDMGRRIERAINQTSLIRSGFSQDRGESRSDLEALLEVSDSIMTYRARYRTTFQLVPVLDLLIVDESNPKSLAFQCTRLAAHVDRLPRQSDRRFSTSEERMALEMQTAVRLLDLNGLITANDEFDVKGLDEFLERVEKQLMEFGQQVSAHYLSRVPATPHYSAMNDDPRP